MINACTCNKKSITELLNELRAQRAWLVKDGLGVNIIPQIERLDEVIKKYSDETT